MDETAYNYNPSAFIEDGSCLYTVYLSFGDINITGYDSTGYGGYEYCDGMDNDGDGWIDEDGACEKLNPVGQKRETQSTVYVDHINWLGPRGGGVGQRVHM